MTNEDNKLRTAKMKTHLVTVMLTLILTWTLTALVQAQADQNEILRTNYGYTIQATGNKIQLTSNEARMVFHYNIQSPQTIGVSDDARLHWGPSEHRAHFQNSIIRMLPCPGSGANCRSGRCPDECHRIMDIAGKLFNFKRDMVTLLHMRQREINELILDITDHQRNKRGLGNLIGGGLSWAFGLATDDDVSDIKQLMHQVLAGTKHAVDAWSRGQNLVTRVTKLTTERFDHIDRLLNLTQADLVWENSRLQSLRAQTQTTQRLLADAIDQIDLGIKHLHESESLYLALKDLSQNRLSHHLVDKDQLKASLVHLTTVVKQHTPDAELVHKTIRHYYTETKVATAFYRHGDKKTDCCSIGAYHFK